METNKYQNVKIDFIDLDSAESLSAQTDENATIAVDRQESVHKIQKSRIPDRIFLILGICFLVLFCVSAFFLAQYYLAYRAQAKSDQTFADLRQQDLDNYGHSPDLKDGDKAGGTMDAASFDVTQSEFYKINSDYVGFLSVPKTDISYPVVQKDNEYYLNHNFYCEKNSHGAIFLDENCNPESDILLIYGHHMKDGTMFYPLKEYKKEDFRKKHQTICLDRGVGNETYRVFAVALMDFTKEDCFDYSELPVNSIEKANYLDLLKTNSVWWDEEVFLDNKDVSQQIVMLSTCDYGSADQRLVVAAVKE